MYLKLNFKFIYPEVISINPTIKSNMNNETHIVCPTCLYQVNSIVKKELDNNHLTKNQAKLKYNLRNSEKTFLKLLKYLLNFYGTPCYKSITPCNTCKKQNKSVFTENPERYERIIILSLIYNIMTNGYYWSFKISEPKMIHQ